MGDIHYKLQEHSWSRFLVSNLSHRQIYPSCLSFSYRESEYHVDQRHGMSCIPKYQVRHI